ESKTSLRDQPAAKSNSEHKRPRPEPTDKSSGGGSGYHKDPQIGHVTDLIPLKPAKLCLHCVAELHVAQLYGSAKSTKSDTGDLLYSPAI
ncbi:hypothetical protein J6590_107770, partial [Homalodisca vitripennis]